MAPPHNVTDNTLTAVVGETFTVPLAPFPATNALAIAYTNVLNVGVSNTTTTFTATNATITNAITFTNFTTNYTAYNVVQVIYYGDSLILCPSPRTLKQMAPQPTVPSPRWCNGTSWSPTPLDRRSKTPFI